MKEKVSEYLYEKGKGKTESLCQYGRREEKHFDRMQERENSVVRGRTKEKVSEYL